MPSMSIFLRATFILTLLYCFAGSTHAKADDVGGINATNNPGSLTGTGLEQVNQRDRLNRKPQFGLVKGETIQSTDEVIKLALPDSINPQDFHINETLHHLQISGNTIFTKEDFKPLVDDFLKSPRQTPDVQKLIRAIDRKYYEAGYLTTKTLFEGESEATLKLRVVEGHISQIKIEGNRFQNDKRILKQLGIKEGDVLNLDDLQQKIEALHESQDLYKLKAKLTAGKEAGESVLTYDVEERLPIKLTAFTDNRGRPLIGQVRWGNELTYDNPLGLGDQFTLSYTGAKNTTIAETAYTLPINEKGTTAGVAYSFAYVNPENRGGTQRLTGQANNYSVFLTQDASKLIDGLSFNTGFNVRKIRAYLDGTQSGESDVTSATIGFNWDKQDKIGRSNLNATLTSGMQLWGGDMHFNKYEVGATRTFNLPHNQFIVLHGYGMYSPEPIPGFEQMQIGGSASVRGYTEGLLFGDRGVNFNAEYRYPIWGLDKIAPKLAENLQGVVFADVAQVLIDRDTAGRGAGVSKRDSTTLVGTGGGLRLSVNDWVEGFLDIGVGLMDRAAKEPTAQPSARVHFGFRTNLLPQSYKKRHG